VRHPQYPGFVLAMFGFLLQWPTIVTLLMFPVLLVMYWRLALAEERDVIAPFGERYLAYRATTPAAHFPYAPDPARRTPCNPTARPSSLAGCVR
jgi:protein-S-isoprenylcysteine O-methyltransferase Ste14